jgi:hypothetical protein
MIIASAFNWSGLFRDEQARPFFKERKMNKFYLSLICLLSLCTSAQAANVQRLFQDVKLPTQSMLERQTILAPIVATTNRVLATNAGPTAATALTVSTFAAQPDVPRNITITPTGTTGDVEACVIVVTGTNFFGQSINESFTFLADASTAQTGSKAFKSVTSVAFPADCESGGFAATWIVGVGSKLGLKRCMANAGDVIHANFDGATETVGAVGSSASLVSANTYTPTGTMNAAKNVIVDFVQNFACFP